MGKIEPYTFYKTRIKQIKKSLINFNALKCKLLTLVIISLKKLDAQVDFMSFYIAYLKSLLVCINLWLHGVLYE